MSSSDKMFYTLSAIALLSLVTYFFYCDLREIKQLTGHSVTSLQSLRANCEKSLPRDKQCQLSVVAHVEEDK